MDEPGADGVMDVPKEAPPADLLHNINNNNHGNDKDGGVGDPTPSDPEEEEICLDSGDEAEGTNTPLACNENKAEPDVQKDAQSTPSEPAPPTQHLSQAPAGDQEGRPGAGSNSGDHQPSTRSLPDRAGEPLPPTTGPSGDLKESSPSVLEGTTEEDLLTLEEVRDTPPPAAEASQEGDTAPSNPSPEGLTGSSPAFGATTSETGALPSSAQRPPEPSPPPTLAANGGIPNGGVPNGPSTPPSVPAGSSVAPSPQTDSPDPAAVRSHALSSPYDTDCSRKLLAEIQRSVSQESLLDELESEILACRLPGTTGGGGGPGGKGNRPVNGAPKEQQREEEECMAAFEKCVQHKYTQQEHAIKR
ncbi:uncharacterized protein LOC130371144 [Gadus chalcogrammus]|nr:uncharacterized protein LOC130371144 [Gadus chalcogrammus]